jgi:hypothetical protein
LNQGQPARSRRGSAPALGPTGRHGGPADTDNGKATPPRSPRRIPRRLGRVKPPERAVGAHGAADAASPSLRHIALGHLGDQRASQRPLAEARLRASGQLPQFMTARAPVQVAGGVFSGAAPRCEAGGWTPMQRTNLSVYESNDPVLQGLAEGFQGIATELGQLVETGAGEPRFGVSGSERQRRGPVPGRLGGEADSAGGRAPGDAVVGQRDLAGLGDAATAGSEHLHSDLLLARVGRRSRMKCGNQTRRQQPEPIRGPSASPG